MIGRWLDVEPQDDGPFWDLNLMKYHSVAQYHDDHPAVSGRTADDAYAPLGPLAAIGAVVAFHGDVLEQRLGEPVWDRIGVVRYPTRAAFLTLFIDGEHLVFDYNCFGDHHVVDSDLAVPVGPSVVGVRFRRRDDGGETTLVIDGADCGTVSVPFVMRMISSTGANVGFDHGSPVSERYGRDNAFGGTLERVDIDLVSGWRPESTESAEQAAADERATMAQQ